MGLPFPRTAQKTQTGSGNANIALAAENWRQRDLHSLLKDEGNFYMLSVIRPLSASIAYKPVFYFCQGEANRSFFFPHRKFYPIVFKRREMQKDILLLNLSVTGLN